MNRKTISILTAIAAFLPMLLMLFAAYRTGEMPSTEITVKAPAPITEWLYRFGEYLEVVSENNNAYTMPTGYYYAVQSIMMSAAIELISAIPAIIMWLPRKVREIFE